MNTPALYLADPNKLEKVLELLQGLVLTAETQRKIRDVFESEMELGLAKNPPVASSLQMENTFLPELCDGFEEGDYLSLDLGGTNFRVIWLSIKSGAVINEEVQYYQVPEDVRLGPGVKLFDFLAECIHNFMDGRQLKGQNLPLGFTFSFPMTQRGLDVGILVSWTKSFNCSGVVGEDAVKMLNDAIHRRGDTDVDVIAVLNDTTGTLVQGAFVDRKCAIGLILGTGSNACYIERADRIEKWEGKDKGVEEVVIDVEWGAFGDNGVLDFIKTEYDKEVDRNSLLVGSFTFEKHFGGKYLGEIVRCVLVRLTKEGLLFQGNASEHLLRHGAFTTRYVSMIEEDNVNGVDVNTTTALKELELSFNQEDIDIVKYICWLVSDRAAILVSICTASLLERMNRPETTVAIDGSLFKHHPRLKSFMEKYIAAMAPANKFKLMLAEDGSGKGAGLIAAIASRLKKLQAKAN
ncbi:LOW QUALITY PROTEIN: hexokinase-2 [Daphnia magna]|uniref:LOW QUALITY PROTEIN: hexokinase-2 n=1 Tax=Daphnia magna TaxID=35525 RepID=UPI001E1BBAB1|nr:LOW QUALITY PROTEIN: hexokinase-2 [Daphnia magna]